MCVRIERILRARNAHGKQIHDTYGSKAFSVLSFKAHGIRKELANTARMFCVCGGTWCCWLMDMKHVRTNYIYSEQEGISYMCLASAGIAHVRTDAAEGAASSVLSLLWLRIRLKQDYV